MQLEEHSITSSRAGYTRKAWLLPGSSGQPHPLYVFLDGEVYMDEMDAVPIITKLMTKHTIPAATCLFVSYGHPDQRLADFTCNDAFSRFIAEDVVGWARQRNAAIRPDRHLIAGASLSGLAGAYITFRYPELFSFALCQSGSFWWLKDREISWPATTAKFWLSVGSKETATQLAHPDAFQEMSQIEGVERAAREFSSLGGRTEYRLFSGGHAPAAWKTDLSPGLTWLLQGA